MLDQLPHDKTKGVALTKEQLRALFKKHDKNGDNLLSKVELREALKEEIGLGWIARHLKAWRGFKRADANGDGLIDEGELDGLVDYVHSKGFKKH